MLAMSRTLVLVPRTADERATADGLRSHAGVLVVEDLAADPGLLTGLCLDRSAIVAGTVSGLDDARTLAFPLRTGDGQALHAWVETTLAVEPAKPLRMPKLTPLTADELEEALTVRLQHWRVDVAAGRGGNGIDVRLERSFRLPDYLAAARFALRIAEIADAQDHHPRLGHLWRTVEVSMTTTDAGNRLSARDAALAEALDTAFEEATAG